MNSNLIEINVPEGSYMRDTSQYTIIIKDLTLPRQPLVMALDELIDSIPDEKRR